MRAPISRDTIFFGWRQFERWGAFNEIKLGCHFVWVTVCRCVIFLKNLQQVFNVFKASRVRFFQMECRLWFLLSILVPRVETRDNKNIQVKQRTRFFFSILYWVILRCFYLRFIKNRSMFSNGKSLERYLL